MNHQIMNNTENQDLSSSIRNRLIEAIKYSGMTHTAIAKKAHVTPNAISGYIHKGKLPTLETFALICDAIDVSSDEILGLKQ